MVRDGSEMEMVRLCGSCSVGMSWVMCDREVCTRMPTPLVEEVEL